MVKLTPRVDFINNLHAHFAPKNSKAKILFEFWPHGMKMAGFDPLQLIVYMLEDGFTLREESSGFQLSTENASGFIKKIHGKKYTDIEAFKLT
jgi:hypothetical protein